MVEEQQRRNNIYRENMKKFMIVYKDAGGFKCGEEIEGVCENDAILTLVDNLREDCDFISEIIEVYETN